MKDLMEGYREGNSMPIADSKPYKRVMIGIPMTGLLRAEWVLSRYAQVIPCNWSQVEAISWLDQCSPIDFSVADARNYIASAAVEQGFEWLFFIDHDTVIPPGTFTHVNDVMIHKRYPVWSGLYFTRSVPSEPLVYRGRGTGYFANWKMGDIVEVDGLPMGCTLIHCSVLKALYDISEGYELRGKEVRKIFETPGKVWYSPEERSWFTATGTEDLAFCTRVIKERILEKAGWPEFAKKEFPFVIDTNIFCKHIEQDGTQYPSRGEEYEFIKEEASGN